MSKIQIRPMMHANICGEGAGTGVLPGLLAAVPDIEAKAAHRSPASRGAAIR